MSKNICQNATIHNIRLDSHFTITSNDNPADVNLSWGAKGLLWYLLSKPADWNVRLWQLSEIYTGTKRGNGSDAIYGFIKELRENGFIKYTKSQNELGHWQHRYDVYPMKIPDFQNKFPQPVKPDVVKPALVKPVISLSTELPRTESPNNDIPLSSSSRASEVIDDDEPAGGGNIKDEIGDVEFTTTKGVKEKISQTDIYRHFTGKPYSTNTIRQSIRRTKTATGSITNILKYIESVCIQIDDQIQNKWPSKKVNASKIEKKDEKPEDISKKERFDEKTAGNNLNWVIG